MKTQCKHLQDPQQYTKSLQGRKIMKDQCVRCFHEPIDQQGLFLCMKCFNGFCPTDRDAHSKQHEHLLYVQIVMTVVKQPEQYEITKLAIGKEGGALGGPEYTTEHKIYCNQCKSNDLEGSQQLDGQLKSVINTDSPFKKSALVSWELEIHPCEHSLTLEQNPVNKDLTKCAQCQLSTNLWLCLVCGNVGCGRKQPDGTGGNQHAISHSDASKHPLVVKLGTITAEGEASLYCYTCNTDVKDNLLRDHLEVLGIQIDRQKKTQKTIVEQSLDLNLNFSLSKLIEADGTSKMLYGPDYTGIENIGNSCYMNSVIQTLAGLEEFTEQYMIKGKNHIEACTRVPGNCFYCQVSKVFEALHSGKYSAKLQKKSVINDQEVMEEYQKGIRPYDFKLLIAGNNVDFLSSKQQDALEYMQYFFDCLEKEEPKYGNSLAKLFNFQTTNHLTCCKCHNYKIVNTQTNEWKIPVPQPSEKDIEIFQKKLEQEKDEDLKKCKRLEDPEYDVKLADCLELLKVGDSVELSCPKCQQNNEFISRHYFKSVPKYLLMVANRFVVENWAPKKLNALLHVPQQLSLSDFLFSNAKVQGQLMKQQKKKKYSEENLMIMTSMGYHQNAAIRALSEKNDNLEAACNYIMENMDKNLEAPVKEEDENSGAVEVDGSLVQTIVEMGMTDIQAKIALIKHKSNVPEALEWLFTIGGDVTEFMYLLQPPKKQPKEAQASSQESEYKLKAVIVHLGKSIHCGHYVAYVKKDNDWVLFNDEKVILQGKPALGKGFVYLYEQKK